MTVPDVTSTSVNAPCQQPPRLGDLQTPEKQQLANTAPSIEEVVDMTFSTCLDSYDASDFFYFSSETEKKQKPKKPEEPKFTKPLPAAPKRISRRQWLILLDFVIVNFCGATCVSLQAPFYPAEAEKKGISPSAYGFVFGVFELVVFLVSPLYGKFIGRIGPKFLVIAGVFLTSTCCILFGLLDKIGNKNTFLAFSFMVRIVEALGQAGYLTGSFTIIAQEFPNKIASTFATLEAAYGAGLILGPTLGGVLYELGGYSLPFTLTGFLLLGTTFLTMVLLPSQDLKPTNNLSMWKLLQVATVVLAGFFTIIASISLGFLTAVLEPHLRQFELSPAEMGGMFIISGGFYAMSTPVWGRLSEIGITPCLVCGCGALLQVLAYMLIGPSPMLPFDTVMSVTIIGLVFHGLGVAAELVGSFSLAHKGAVQYGFPDNIETYGLVSGFWTSLFAFGAFLGPSVGGVLLDQVGFELASQVILVLQVVAGCVTIGWMCRNGTIREFPATRKDSCTIDERTPLLVC